VTRNILILPLLAIPLFAQGKGEPLQIQTVYLLRMRGGFDQYLANRVTGAGFFHVVTDPAKADAILTDRLGRPFEDQMLLLYPPPPPPPPPPSEKTEDEEKPASGSHTISIHESEKPHSTTLGGGSGGTVFLVDRRSRSVVWSTFAKPKSYTAKEMDATAGAVVKKLQETMFPPPAK
jgi:hypothetical protein